VDQIGYELICEQVFEQVDFLLQKKDEVGKFDNQTTYDMFSGLGGTLTNNTNRDLSHVAILVEDKIYYVGDWKIGQTIQLDTLKSDTLTKYSWSTSQGTITPKQAAQNVLGKKETNMLLGFLFGSNGASYKKDQARMALVEEYALTRYTRSSYMAAVFGFSESDETYGQAADGKWKEYGQTLVYSDILLNPHTAASLRNIKPSVQPAVDPAAKGYINQETSMSDSSKTFLVAYNMDTIDFGYTISGDDKRAFFVSSVDDITGQSSDPYSFSYSYYSEFRGTIWVYNYTTGGKDSFAPGDSIPLGVDSPYVRNGMMLVTFENDPSQTYEDIVIPELYVEKGE
ncbi:MAG: hypothetical protein J5825_04630, partial [Lachnospiraceae bacterium]|nr:hypothetical protein [Lachnospiraceae bacterium]